uniref:Integrin, alpha V n=1 Tax=Gasterosteus aculeatus aculeatus TaxID=481459 RepID=A0AAQ4RY50_GASAC
MSGTRAALGALALMCLLVRRGGTFNLDARTPSVFSGPTGSYFGFSVDFFSPADVLVGAPRANTTPSSSVEERGAVYSCPWKTSTCQQLQFDITGTRKGAQMEFKSKQWFGASVRSDGEHILACAPLYQWSTFGVSEREPVGTCYLKKESTVVEYSPCRSKANSPEGQGFCQAGFSVDFLKNNRVVVGGPGSFYWQGQLISDDLSEIFSRFDSLYITQYENTLATKSAIAQYDDSYLGNHGHTHSLTRTHAHTHTMIVTVYEAITPPLRLQMAAYFGHSVAASDVNNDDWVDLLVGAPLFMDRGSDGKLREVGQVSVYLSRGGFSFHPPQLLTGSEVYARYGSAIAALGDLDMDGYNDVAISAPYGGPDHHGVVYIHNGRQTYRFLVVSQVLQGRWASSYMPASFGYSMTGNTDIDQNGYPDLIVGVFGADKAVLYSFTVKYCLKASGRGAPATLNFRVDLLLDRLKQKDATKRVLFLHSRTLQFSKNMTVSNGKAPTCEEQEVFLRDDREFRDKITPISVAMEYSLDHQRAADQTGLQPILDMSAPSNVTKQAHILLDCGEDNICKPDLRLSVTSDREQIFIGDDNALTLEVSAENLGEGAYEAELHVFPPQQADFTGVVRSQSLSRLSCAYKKENQTKMVVCDLGNPMKGGTKVLAELQFSVHQLSEEDTSVKFDVQMVRYGPVELHRGGESVAPLSEEKNRRTLNVSDEDFLLPITNWKPQKRLVYQDDMGPQILHVYELLNSGPSTISKAALEVEWPYRYTNGSLLYITSYQTDGPMNCTTDVEINALNLSVRRDFLRNKRDVESTDAQNDLHTLDCSTAECLRIRCQVGRLERTKNAILFIYSRLAVDTFLKPENQNRSYVVHATASFSVIEMPYKNLVPELPSNSTTVRDTTVSVMWVADPPQQVPGWVVALAVLSGLLLLALLIFIMYKLGFFKRVRPPQEDCTEKEQLQPEENGNTDA